MRLLYIFRSLAVWGGIERILVDKMNSFAKLNDMDVYLLTTDQGNHTIPFQLDDRVRVKDLDICFCRRYQYGRFRRIWMLHEMKSRFENLLAIHIQEICPDVVICTTSDPISSIAKVKGDIPLVVESHSICSRTIGHGRNWLFRKINRYYFLKCLSKTEALIALTTSDAMEWQQFHSNVKVIPNMVHIEEGKVSQQANKHAIFVGRFDYQKQVQSVIRIWSLVSKKYPEWVLDIFGDGEMANEIEMMAYQVPNVKLHKPVSNIFDYYRESSFLLSTSLFEPFGLVIPEAMSCGLPVVAFDCPFGPAEIISDGVDGFLVENGDISEFVQKVGCLIDNIVLREEMGRRAIEASKKYSSEFIIPIWKRFFEDVSSKCAYM